MENTKSIQVYSEKKGKMVDIDVVTKDTDGIFASCVMLVVDEEE